MKLDSLTNELQHLLTALTRGDATWKIWHVGHETGWAFLCNDHVAHVNTKSLRIGLQRPTW